MTKFVLIAAGILLFVGLVGGAAIYVFEDKIPIPQAPSQKEIFSFIDCVAAGNAVMESYPRQCNTQDGKHFVENIGNELEKTDVIHVNNPRPNQEIISPLRITGEARGYWFFEASFPIRLVDSSGNDIPLTPGYIMTSEDWMTENFVTFDAMVEFTAPAGTKGTLILAKDNPSGLSQNDDQLVIPITFGQSDKSQEKGVCKPTGCSGQICSDQEVTTTCEYREEFACYKSAVCQRQTSGECGWTQTTELSQCLTSAQNSSSGTLPNKLEDF